MRQFFWSYAPVFACIIIQMTYHNGKMIPSIKNPHKKRRAGKTHHTMDKNKKKKAKHHVQEIELIINPCLASNNRWNDNAEETDGCKPPPPREVSFKRCSEESETLESIGIGKFAMRTSRKGNITTFKMGIREKVFPKVKFLGGTNTTLDYSMEPMSVCGLLKRHCNIDDVDARLWWEIQCTMVKGIHTDCRNNKIKMIKQIFMGKYKGDKHKKKKGMYA